MSRIDLDMACGATITYRELLECSNTWKRAAAEGEVIDNIPKIPSTFEALQALAVEIVDPIAVHFGRPTLTYGFGGPALTKRIKAQIAPHLDQHASHERRGDRPICARLGAAVDLLVPGVSAFALARWTLENRRPDRIYVYGDDRPIHVSVGPEQARVAFELRRVAGGRQVPVRISW